VNQTTTDPIARWEEILPLLDPSRSGLVDPAGEFLRALASFVTLHQAELEEAEREAIASFDDQHYHSPLPEDVRWSRIAEAPLNALAPAIERVWEKLGSSSDGQVMRNLRRIPTAVRLASGMDAILDAARRVVADMPLATAQGKRDLSIFFEDAVARYISNTKYTAEFASDENLVRLVVDLAAPRLGERIYDPCFGLGGFLSEAARRVISGAESLPPAGWREAQERSVFGVEINASAWLIGLARVILAGVAQPNLELGNTLERALPRDRSTEGFDVIMANLPFGYTARPSDQFRVKANTAESGFLQHILGHLKLGGRAVVVVPHSVLFRHGADEMIRRQMLEEFHLDAVVSLTAGWLQGTSVKASILCVSRREPAKEVVFVGERLWDEGLESHAEPGNRRGILLDAVHYRQALLTQVQAQAVRERHLDRLALKHLDTFDDFNVETGYVTSAGDSERFRDFIEKLELIRLLPPGENEGKSIRTLQKLPELHGVRLAWTVPSLNLANRHWELVAKETGEQALEDFLKKLQERDESLTRITLGDVADLFPGVGYQKEGVVEVDYSSKASGTKTRTHGVISPVEAITMPLVPLVRVQDVGPGKRESTGDPSVRRPSMSLNEKGMERVRDRHRLRVGDILLTASGTVGNLGIVPEGLAGAVAAKSIIVIRSRGAFTPLALMRLLQTAPYQEWIRGGASGSVIQHFSARILKQMPLLAFTAEQQKRLAQQLKDVSDADAVLEAFSALSGESVWISSLLNNQWVQVLTKAGNDKGYTEEWWDSLQRFVLMVSNANEAYTNPGAIRDAFHQSLLSWADHALDLLDAMELPPGMDRYGALQAWDKMAMHELMGSKDRLHSESKADALASRAAEKFTALCEVLLDAADTECTRITRTVGLAIDIGDPFIPADRPTDIQLELKNTGIAPIRKLQFNVDKPQERHDLALLSGGSSARWVISLPPQPAGPVLLTLRWQGQLLSGESWSGSTSLPIESRQAGESTNDVRPKGNPYKVGTPIEAEDRLYGRDGIIHRISDALPVGEDPAVLILRGNRRAGKTSILKKLLAPAALPGWIPVFSDFQSTDSGAADSSFTAHALFRMLARDVLDAVLRFVPAAESSRIETIAANAAPLLFSGTDSSGIGPFDSFRSLLSRLLKELRPVRMLLMMDEFEKLQDGIDAGTLNPQVLDNFRALFQHQRGIATVLSGSPRIKKLQEEYWGILFGLGVVEPVGPLDMPSARQLVTEPATGRLVFSLAAVDRICELAARQPYLIQSLCHQVFTLSNERGDHAVAPEMVEEAAQRFAESSIYFRDVFRTYIRSARQRYLAFLIDHCAKGPDRVTFELLFTKLEDAGLPYTRMALKQDLEELRELEVAAIEETVFGVSYRINVPLFSLWLHENEDPDTHLAVARLE
jgi:type I restriction enzyme M protein